ncbi:arrestin domain-containing protein 3 isoform X2 [Alosa pseudoharengus]|uniref:arrestin domain-containing protein 3 isoform X2 n=1 Tax=Alosa pseudoharengus TaxID=34774 RepID=UPI003F8CAE44
MGIQSISVDYDAINQRNIFSNGDYISGRVTVEVSSQTRIQSLTLKAKGKAKVLWTEHYHETTVVYYDKEKYFSQEQYLLKEGQSSDGALKLGPGRHVYPFTFQIPNKNMPSSFKGCHGKIRYTLLAKLNRSMAVAKKAKTLFTFVSKADMAAPELMTPQYGSKDKEVSFFASGNIAMNIFTERMGYHQGEEVPVVTEIVNSSTRKVIPKFYIYQKQSFFAQGRRRVSTNDILKQKWPRPLESSTRETVTQKMTIPPEIPPSILNCRILKAVLSVSLTKDPLIKLPLIVLPRGDDGSKEKRAKPKAMHWPDKSNHHSSDHWPDKSNHHSSDHWPGKNNYHSSYH